MTIFYLFGIWIFNVLVSIVSLFNPKASLWIKGRKNLFKNLEHRINPLDKIAWFHCASLGEFEQGRPVIEAFKEKYSEYKILLTFYSPSGYEVRKNYEKADYVFYLPIDTPKNAKRFLSIVNPQVVFFIKYEFWYFFLREIKNRNIPLYLVSGIFRENQLFFKKFGAKCKKMLSWFTHFFVQNEESKELLQSINIDNVTVTGDTRFDRVYAITQQSKDLPLIKKFTENSLVLVAGSTWKPDEDILLKYYNETKIPFKLIIAPHEIYNENIKRIIKTISEQKVVIRNSEATEENIKKADVIIIDSIGLLSSVYKYGNVAYIGGGFGKGIHNILEAATFGLPIIFGSNYNKFKEAVDLIKLGGSASISNYEEIRYTLDSLLENKDNISLMGKISSEFVNKNKGATTEILNFVDVK